MALNQHTGGVNPATVRSALASGGRVVWFPTADSHTQAAACLPRLSDQDARLPRTTYAVPQSTELSTRRTERVWCWT
ncbi:DUF6282 family protein [Arsenicicoccus piscis]|uniref:DUF6282 family protein n=1 Tax=Arsenicicoccus piscis TaxID=673954 RepID=UPI003D66B7A5